MSGRSPKRVNFIVNVLSARAFARVCRSLLGGWLLPEIQVAVAGSLGVLQVVAQIGDRFKITPGLAFDAAVTQVAYQPLQLHPSHPHSANRLPLGPATQRRFQTARDIAKL